MTTDKETAQNLVDKHPALQIYETLQTIRERSSNRAGTLVSRIWMNAIDKEVSSFNTAWFKLLGLLERWRKSVEQAPDTNDLKQKTTLDFIQRVFDLTCQMNNMNGQQFMDAFSDDIMSMLILTPDEEIMEIESPLTGDDLSSIQQQIIDLMNSVRNSSLPAEVKQGLLSALYELMAVIEDYDVNGVEDLIKATERYAGTLVRHNSALEENSSKDSGSLKEKLRGLAGNIFHKTESKLKSQAIEAASDYILSLTQGQM